MSAVFVTCPKCERLMLGQRTPFGTLPQPHDCKSLSEQCQACREGVPDYIAPCCCVTVTPAEVGREQIGEVCPVDGCSDMLRGQPCPNQIATRARFGDE